MTGARRKLLFTLVATVVVLLGLEFVARGIEWATPPAPLRPLPTPGHHACLPDCLPGAAELPERPEHLPTGIAMVQHPTRTWSLPPSTVMSESNVRVRVNSMGLRGPEVPRERVEGEVRLMSLGDSSVFGYGVEESRVFVAVAAQNLGQRWGRQIRPINGGTPGYTSQQSLIMLKTLGPEIRPDWVLVACIWSDLFQTEREPESRRRPESASSLYRLALRWLGPYLPTQRVGWVDVERSVGTPQSDRAARTALEAYRGNLGEIVSTSTALGARTLFVVLPAPMDLDAVEPPAFIAEYRSAMHEAAVTAGVPIVDGPALFRRFADNSAFYDQVHPSQGGHEILGRAAADMIVDAAGIPTDP